MISFQTFFALGFAGYFLGLLFSRKDLFAFLRSLPDPIGKAFGCSFCASWWSTLVLALGLTYIPQFTMPLIFLFGAAGLALVALSLSGALDLDEPK